MPDDAHDVVARVAREDVVQRRRRPRRVGRGEAAFAVRTVALRAVRARAAPRRCPARTRCSPRSIGRLEELLAVRRLAERLDDEVHGEEPGDEDRRRDAPHLDLLQPRALEDGVGIAAREVGRQRLPAARAAAVRTGSSRTTRSPSVAATTMTAIVCGFTKRPGSLMASRILVGTASLRAFGGRDAVRAGRRLVDRVGAERRLRQCAATCRR